MSIESTITLSVIADFSGCQKCPVHAASLPVSARLLRVGDQNSWELRGVVGGGGPFKGLGRWGNGGGGCAVPGDHAAVTSRNNESASRWAEIVCL